MLLCSLPLFADGLVKFKGWDNTPQGYFMTKAEHDQWAAIRTDEEAQGFVDSFLAKRGPDFATEVASRVEQADKHLTVGKIPGSKTLRGKLIILLGPPSGFDKSEAVNNDSVHHDNASVASAYSGGSSALEERDGNEGSRTMGVGTVTHNYHFTYTSGPAGPFEVTISVDPNKGTDRLLGREDAKRLDAAFEAAAQASIKTK
jgi:GWxTD domain-containing protein